MIRFLVSSLAALVLSSPPPSQSQNPPLRIVVIAGEDAVNVIQQKTAVAPLIEIRDRNNVPIAGATVTFSIGGNSASFAGGAQTLTVVTNTAGQAAAAGLSPVASGAVQINVAAAFQGQTALATIAQTNVMTVAEVAGATGATSATGASGATGATGAAGGGGVSGTTLGIAGAAVAGGVVAATQVVGGDEPATTAATPVPEGPRVFRTTVASTITLTFQGCVRVETWAVTFEITITATEPLAGNARVSNGSTRVESVTCSGGPQQGATGATGMPLTPITGTAGNITFTSEVSNAFAPSGPNDTGGINTEGYRFAGALSGSEINGALTHFRRIESNSGGVPGTGSSTAAVTLRQ